MTNKPVTIHWFRRDLRLSDNVSLNAAHRSGSPVLCVFIFDTEILDKLPEDDARVTFIHDTLADLNDELRNQQSGLLVKIGNPVDVWKHLLDELTIAEVHVNTDYEPYARERDSEVAALLEAQNISFHSHTDQVIFEPGKVLKDDGDPYTVYTPYRRKWMTVFDANGMPPNPDPKKVEYARMEVAFPSLNSIGFTRSNIEVPPPNFGHLDQYGELRDDPAGDHTTHLSPHLRFGTVSIREVTRLGLKRNKTFLGELIWREFFMQILYHFPHVINESFKPQYDAIEWRNNEKEFELWCQGKTGYPMVDAGMRQLNQTGFMHNRVRMVVASFLTKHLLIDWRWGEAYFAEKLLDYELSSNNGNWQWAAGTGCDAAPYFRIFNPTTQLKKFDPEYKYVRKWLPDLDTMDYPDPIVDHKLARERALDTYRAALQ